VREPSFGAIKDIRNKTMNTKNRILAIPVAVPAIPPKPNIAAIIATTRNVIAQFNIKSPPD
jgi:hypothetical protein